MRRSLATYNQVSGLSGFSLLEMLIALTIMGMALSVLYESVSGATRNMRVAGEYAIATALAESTMDQFAQRLGVGDQAQGEFGEYRWLATAEPVASLDNSVADIADKNDLLSLITVSVEWQGLGGNRVVTLHTIERAVGVDDAS